MDIDGLEMRVSELETRIIELNEENQIQINIREERIEELKEQNYSLRERIEDLREQILNLENRD